MNYKIGVDGGGTTTRAVVIDESLNVLGRGEAGSSNHYSVGPERAIENIRRAVDSALSNAQVLAREVEGWGLGLAGACTASEQDLLRPRLEAIAPGTRVLVDEDAAAAQSGAFGGGEGVVCIAGTGANCFGINVAGERARADGLGPLLGDRGSGYSIGENALRAICEAYDSSGPATTLLQPVLQAMGVTSVDELVQTVYQPDFKRDRVAAVFPVVLEHARQGDAVAIGLLENAGAALAASTAAILRKLGLSRVAVTGGVLTLESPVRERFSGALQEVVPGVSIESPQYDAAIGAALLLKGTAV
jgi:N-acetylglucosamine kinase